MSKYIEIDSINEFGALCVETVEIEEEGVIIGDRLFYYWTTEEPHHDNSETMEDFLSCELSVDIEVTYQDGTYAEIKLEDGRSFEVHASGNGDCCNHKVEFVEMELDA